ncbi:MAG: hypothetical protein LC772_12685, partial [Chloroflexi bacterium]|nr:hypothetical protein [Chloroflexota bacterium]
YTDILPADAAHPVDSNHDLVPQHVVLQADGKRMTAWKTWDGLQDMKRCPDFWVPAARKVIPAVLKQFPFLGRFIDVTTAEALYECYDPDHPLTRGDKRQRGEDLLRYVGSQGLVVGGEHGIWWGVPSLDYIEGMMSSSYYSWPAGYLIHPVTKDQPFTDPSGHKLGPWANYARWGIGYQWRAPLWELVFHDCVVSTWYWGDASDFLLQAAPEITARKDAFNILYGTIPLLWANQEGSWVRDRAVFLRTYRDTCKLHEVLAGTRLTDHQFLTDDHALQRTRFSDGTMVTVNFGQAPQAITLNGHRVSLPENGWVVRGPRIEQSRVIAGGAVVTTIRAPGYYFSDSGGPITARVTASNEIRLLAGPSRNPVWFRPAEVSPGWDQSTTRAYVVDDQGLPVHSVPLAARGGQLRIGPFPTGAALVLLCRADSYIPELQVQDGRPLQAVQGRKVRLTTVVSNTGRAPAPHVQVTFYADGVLKNRKLGGTIVSLA